MEQVVCKILCCRFTRLHFFQIWATLVNIWQRYYKNIGVQFLLRHNVYASKCQCLVITGSKNNSKLYSQLWNCSMNKQTHSSNIHNQSTNYNTRHWNQDVETRKQHVRLTLLALSSSTFTCSSCCVFLCRTSCSWTSRLFTSSSSAFFSWITSCSRLLRTSCCAAVWSNESSSSLFSASSSCTHQPPHHTPTLVYTTLARMSHHKEIRRTCQK